MLFVLFFPLKSSFISVHIISFTIVDIAWQIMNQEITPYFPATFIMMNSNKTLYKV